MDRPATPATPAAAKAAAASTASKATATKPVANTAAAAAKAKAIKEASQYACNLAQFDIIVSAVVSDKLFRVVFERFRCEVVLDLSANKPTFPILLSGGFVVAKTVYSDSRKPQQYPKLVFYNTKDHTFIPKIFSEAKFLEGYAKAVKHSRIILASRGEDSSASTSSSSSSSSSEIDTAGDLA
jgi:hypothetical protein